VSEHGRPDAAGLEAAFDDFVAAIGTSAAFVRQHPFYRDPENRAAAYSFLTSMVVARIEEDVVCDARYPFFRIVDPRVREGGDNPDQRYLISPMLGGATYRLWGRVGSARRLDFQVYAGDPYLREGGGRMASFLSFEDLDMGADGAFEVFASPQRQPGNWLENPVDATRILVRQVYSDWADELPGDVHIDRVGEEGSLRQTLTEEAMADRLRKAAADLRAHVMVWPQMVQGYLDRLPPNQLSVPFDPGTLGGVPGRWMSHGTFELHDDEALVVKMWPADGNYQGIQLADLWFSSLEYANRQTSLTADQAQLSDDGCFYFVVSSSDPGVANWLDTTGLRRGVILLRYDGTGGGSFDSDRYPTAAKIKLSEMAFHLPPVIWTVTAEDRRHQIEDRRRHVQVRFGN
jgi:hypothetical protein